MDHIIVHCLVLATLEPKLDEVSVNVLLLLLVLVVLDDEAVSVVLQKILGLLVKEEDLLGNADFAALYLLVVRKQMNHQPIVAPLCVYMVLLLLEVVNLLGLLHPYIL